MQKKKQFKLTSLKEGALVVGAFVVVVVVDVVVGPTSTLSLLNYYNM